MMIDDYIYLISSIIDLCKKECIGHSIYKDNNGLVLQTNIKNCKIIIYFKDYKNIEFQINKIDNTLLGIRTIAINDDTTSSLLKSAIESLFRNTFEGTFIEVLRYVKELSENNRIVDTCLNKKKLEDLYED